MIVKSLKENFQIDFLPLGNADGIHVCFTDEKGAIRHIFIDGGKGIAYKNTIRPRLEAIFEAGERVDLWIITHTDDDHISAVLQFVQSIFCVSNPDLVGSFWFNWSPKELPSESSKISYRQGILLRDRLAELGKLDVEKVHSSESQPIDFFGTTITLLSPDRPRLGAWAEKESCRIAGYSDLDEPLEELMASKFEEDTSNSNGASIAFLWEIGDRKILFTADSHPSAVAEQLKKPPFSCSPENPLVVDLMQIPHHGSSKNLSDELLSLISCPNFVCCAGSNNPSKTVLARILRSRQTAGEPTVFLISRDSPTFEKYFKKEPNARAEHRFEWWQLGEKDIFEL